jgi:hypothetical protein
MPANDSGHRATASQASRPARAGMCLDVIAQRVELRALNQREKIRELMKLRSSAAIDADDELLDDGARQDAPRPRPFLSDRIRRARDRSAMLSPADIGVLNSIHRIGQQTFVSALGPLSACVDLAQPGPVGSAYSAGTRSSVRADRDHRSPRGPKEIPTARTMKANNHPLEV